MVPLMAQEKAFLGKWDITGTKGHEKYVYWLEVKEEGGKLTGNFLNRVASVEPLPEIAIENGELVFSPVTRSGNPKPVHRAKVVGGKLIGTMTEGSETVHWVGVRPPKWGDRSASGDHKFGPPVQLFDGKTMNGWKLQSPDRPSGWSVEDGTMINGPHANNIVSEKKFKDFKVHVEYKLESGSNSGIYLRGRYELQVLDDAGKPPESHGHGAIYSRVPPLVNASKPPGEWQTMEATIVGNRVTAFLNGQKIHDNAIVEGITGGALDADEGAPGPIMIQGDHGKIWVRNVTVTPVLK
jgi:hypothetical protein